jgi:hypothetical protein
MVSLDRTNEHVKCCTLDLQVFDEVPADRIIKDYDIRKIETLNYRLSSYYHFGDYPNGTSHYYGDPSFHGVDNLGKNNSGSRNLGNANRGFYNIGYCNFGDKNIGNSNFGDSNQGDDNIGSSNMGNNNFGNSNKGNLNFGFNNNGICNWGNNNIGNFNRTDGAIGYFNSKPGVQILFNQPYKKTPLLAKQLEKTCAILYNLFVKSLNKTLSYEDYQEVFEYITTSSFRVSPFSSPFCETISQCNARYEKKFRLACNEVFSQLPDSQKLLFKQLPNFSYEIFEEVTGITESALETTSDGSKETKD